MGALVYQVVLEVNLRFFIFRAKFEMLFIILGNMLDHYAS